MCGTKCLFPELLQYSLAPPFLPPPPPPPMQCWTTRRQAFPYEQHCMGEGGGEGRIWPKERLFPCEKLIDGRGSAFCKLVPHNFGQDCRRNQPGGQVSLYVRISTTAVDMFGYVCRLEVPLFHSNELSCIPIAVPVSSPSTTYIDEDNPHSSNEESQTASSQSQSS